MDGWVVVGDAPTQEPPRVERIQLFRAEQAIQCVVCLGSGNSVPMGALELHGSGGLGRRSFFAGIGPRDFTPPPLLRQSGRVVAVEHLEGLNDQLSFLSSIQFPAPMIGL